MVSSMFTGIIRHKGTVKSAAKRDGAVVFDIETPLSAEVAVGDSVAVNGACLTVLQTTKTTWQARLMSETLTKTNLGDLLPGGAVNLERPPSMNQGLDGHFVQGHVDGVCTVERIETIGDDSIFTFKAPAALLPYLIPKGSVALDGVSLTVVDVHNDTFTVSIMPYTMQETTFGSRSTGDRINMEADMIGKYVQSFVRHFKA